MRSGGEFVKPPAEGSAKSNRDPEAQAVFNLGTQLICNPSLASQHMRLAPADERALGLKRTDSL